MMNYAEYNLSCKVFADKSGSYQVMMDFPNGPLRPSFIKNQVDASGAPLDITADQVLTLTLNKSETYTFEY